MQRTEKIRSDDAHTGTDRAQKGHLGYGEYFLYEVEFEEVVATPRGDSNGKSNS
jgi:hypothetical protein